VGPTVVTGITFTTANDTAGRDPIAFELYGSNASIDGPYTLIASRDIIDFAGIFNALAKLWIECLSKVLQIVLKLNLYIIHFVFNPEGASEYAAKVGQLDCGNDPRRTATATRDGNEPQLRERHGII